MKLATKRRKQLKIVDEWLAKARPEIVQKTHTYGWQPEFSLLIAVEQLVVYLKMLEEQNQ